MEQKEFNGLPLFDAEMIDGKFAHGTNFISLVSRPATQQPIFLFSEQGNQDEVVLEDTIKFAVSDSKRGLITGVLMLADTPIKRKVNGKEFYLQFPVALVEKMSFKFMKNLFGRNINKEHNAEEPIHEAYVVESWIFDESRGHSLPDYMSKEEVTPGSWLVTLKVEDEKVIKEIEEGKIVGYSLEGDFGIKVNFEENFVGIEKNIILDANISVEDKFNHIRKTVENVKD